MSFSTLTLHLVSFSAPTPALWRQTSWPKPATRWTSCHLTSHQQRSSGRALQSQVQWRLLSKCGYKLEMCKSCNRSENCELFVTIKSLISPTGCAWWIWMVVKGPILKIATCKQVFEESLWLSGRETTFYVDYLKNASLWALWVFPKRGFPQQHFPNFYLPNFWIIG